MSLDPFSVLGDGDGMPETPVHDMLARHYDAGDGEYYGRRVDVSAYTYWVTLGGTQKGNAPAAGEVADSRLHAMRIVWLLKGLDADVTSGSHDVSDLDYGAPAPGRRAAEHYVQDTPVWAAGLFPPYSRQTSELSGGATDGCLASMAIRAVRMYDGDANDEANYVGYGLESCATSIPSPTGWWDEGSDPTPPFLVAAEGSVRLEVDAYASFMSVRTWSYTTLGGIPLLRHHGASGTESGVQAVLNGLRFWGD